MHEPWLLTAVVVLVGAVIQSSVGFGFGVLVVPTLVYLGVVPEVAIMLVIFLVTPQNLVSLKSLFKHVHVRSMMPFVVWVILIQPIGVWLLTQLKVLSADQIKAFFGIMILVALVLQVCFKVKPRKSLHPGWGGLAFTCSGIMGGICGMHGPPAVIWAMAHDWSTLRIRGSLIFCYVCWAPFLLISLWYQFPGVAIEAIGQVPSILPIALLGVWLGLFLGKRFSRTVLRGLAFILLIFVSIMAILG